MRESPEVLMQAAGEVAQLAGKIALGFYRDRPPTETKADGSPVTEADRSAERAARDWITARFPGDTVAGEEFGVAGGESAGSRRWLIDPIDGTKTFVRGVPLWGTMIAVCEGDDVVAASVYCPAVGELMVAAIGAGCWINGSRSSVSSVATLGEATVLTSNAAFRRTPDRGAQWSELIARAGEARTWGDCYGYLLVASGRAEVMVDPVLADWDSAAVQRCVVEAGGTFTAWNGEPTPFGRSGIATNRALANEVRSILR